MAESGKQPGGQGGGGRDPRRRPGAPEVGPGLSRRASARPIPSGIPAEVPLADEVDSPVPTSPPVSPAPHSERLAPRRREPREAGETAELTAPDPSDMGSTPAHGIRRKAPPGPGKRTAVPSRRGALADEEARAAPFRRGLPLAVKIAAFSAFLVAVLMAGLGLYIVSIATETVEHQINEKGVVAVSELTSFPDPILWFPPTQLSTEAQAALDRRWKSEKSKRLKEWQEKLARLVNDEANPIFLAVRITDDPAGANEPLLEASEGGRLVPRGLASSLIAKAGEVEIYEANVATDHFNGRIRRYTRLIQVIPPAPFDKDDPLLEDAQKAIAERWKPEPRNVGFAHVYIKANSIDETSQAILQKVGIATGAGIGIAVVLAILMAAFVASPLRALVRDMKIVASGDLSHKTIPRSRDEIGEVAAQFNDMTRSLREAQKKEQERQAIEHELAIATEIQTKLLPDRIPQIPGYDLYSFYLSAKEVGGDYYDFLVVDPTHLGIIVADVSGKGIPGSMVMTMVRSLIRLASHRETSPAETLKKVNRILAKDIRRGMFVTAIYAVLDVQRKVLTVSSAGHNPMVYFDSRRATSRLVNPAGIALGFDKGRTFDENIKEEAIDLSPGDRIALYTDGVVEAMNERSEEFGMERFLAIVNASAGASSKDFTSAVVQALERHRGKAEQSDDITITTLKVE
jgi:serine phosphatase RsbU (regulator of sigma subunit)